MSAHTNWIEYQRKSRERIEARRRAAAAGITLCAHRGCMEPVAVRSGRQGNLSRYCVEHTPTCGSEQRRAQEQAQERARLRKAAQRARHAAVLERLGEKGLP
jgi:hypothetical protein